jgi:uncharacterized protein
MNRPCTAFQNHRRVAFGPLYEVALAVSSTSRAEARPVQIYDDATGRVIDLDTRGTAEEIADRLIERIATEPVHQPGYLEATKHSTVPRGRGRPKLGVVAREITLLPRHWDWLSTQPGGASLALRKLVEEAHKTSGAKDRHRFAQEAAYRFMSDIAGNLEGFEEALRALYANDRRKFSEDIAHWPADVREHAIKLAFPDSESMPHRELSHHAGE